VRGASYDVALFRLTEQKVEKILAVGEPNPLDPKQTIRSISSFEAAGPDALLISANTSRFAKTSRFTRTLLLSSRVSAQAAAGSKKLLLYHQGQFSRIFDKAAVPASWQGFEVGQVAFLRDDPPLAIYSLSLSRRPTAEDRRRAQVPRGMVLASVSLADLYCFDGQKVTNLTERIKPEGQFRVLSGDFPGASFIGTPLDFGGTRNLFVDVSTGEPRVLALPAFSTGGDRTLDLNDVVAWKGPGQAIVGLDDGFHLLTRQ
jgi:hypothetical protein